MDLSYVDEFIDKVEVEGPHNKLNVFGEEVENVKESYSSYWGNYIAESVIHQENEC